MTWERPPSQCLGTLRPLCPFLHGPILPLPETAQEPGLELGGEAAKVSVITGLMYKPTAVLGPRLHPVISSETEQPLNPGSTPAPLHLPSFTSSGGKLRSPNPDAHYGPGFLGPRGSLPNPSSGLSPPWLALDTSQSCLSSGLGQALHLFL